MLLLILLLPPKTSDSTIIIRIANIFTPPPAIDPDTNPITKKIIILEQLSIFKIIKGAIIVELKSELSLLICS